jgi:hypothetical protein
VPVNHYSTEEMFVNLDHISKIYKHQNGTYWVEVGKISSGSYEISKETYDEILGKDS